MDLLQVVQPYHSFLYAKQWQKAADYAKMVMDMNYYELWPEYVSLFDVENEPDKNPSNKEMIAVSNASSLHPYGNMIMNCALPPSYHYAQKLPHYEWNTNMRNWASNFRLRDAFTDSFDKENDKRFGLIIEEYMNTKGENVNLRTQIDNARSMKYFDPNCEIASHGNDFPRIRYADILLMRSEALNELNGPNQESIDLLNQVRVRAGLSPFTLGDFGSKEKLRDHIIRSVIFRRLSVLFLTLYLQWQPSSRLLLQNKFVS